MKLVVIGAGSAYAPEIFDGLLTRLKTFTFTEIDLVDIPEGMPRAQIILDFTKRMFQKAGYACQLRLTTDRRQALAGADFVISQIRVGTWRARAVDEQTGMELGLVGQETTGAGGFMNAMRTIPEALAIARDMEALCPDAWLINFTNPSGLVTEAVLKYTKIRCIGLCNVPVNMQADAEKALGAKLHCTFTGLNHLSFLIGAERDGRDVLPLLLEQLADNETLMKNIPKVAGTGELIRALGVIPSPYLQYYYFEQEMRDKQLREWREMRQSRAVQVHAIDEALFRQYRDPALAEKPAELAQRGGSLYSFAALNIIEALLGDTPREMAVNVQNQGSIPGLEDTDVVEMNCRISKAGVARLALPPLPRPVRGLVQTVKHYERLTVQAAARRDRRLAVQALLNHPLIHGYRNAEAVVALLEQRFPQYIHWEED